jgi:dCMP deaminase
VTTQHGSRPSTDEYFLRMAELVATRGTCARRQVGCVLVDIDNHVLSTGYNGVCRGALHCNEITDTVPNPALRLDNGQFRPAEHYELETVPVYGYACKGAKAPSGEGLHLCEAIHAEENALIQCHDVGAIHTVYSTASPCILCMRKLVGTGMKRVVFRQSYPHPDSINLAIDRCISWIHLN